MSHKLGLTLEFHTDTHVNALFVSKKVKKQEWQSCTKQMVCCHTRQHPACSLGLKRGNTKPRTSTGCGHLRTVVKTIQISDL